MTIVMLITFPPMSVSRRKLLLKDLLDLFIDAGILFKKQGFVKNLGPLQVYLTTETIEISISFSKWLVTRTRLSAIAYMILAM